MKYNDFFCSIYNTYGWNYFSETFGEILVEWLERNQIHVQRALDLGCGTGALCHILSEKGIEVTGVDLSEAMIEIAKKTYPKLQFEIGDMTQYQPSKKMDFVTCIYDAINHVLQPEGVVQVFTKVAEYLEDDGCFVFDILNGEEIDVCLPQVLEETEDGVIQFEISKPQRDLLELTFSKISNGKIIHSASSRERIYEREWIVNQLEKVGFQQIKVCRSLLEDSSDEGNGWIIIARKNGGKLDE